MICIELKIFILNLKKQKKTNQNKQTPGVKAKVYKVKKSTKRIVLVTTIRITIDTKKKVMITVLRKK